MPRVNLCKYNDFIFFANGWFRLNALQCSCAVNRFYTVLFYVLAFKMWQINTLKNATGKLCAFDFSESESP